MAIVAIGVPVWQAVKAAERLEEEGISTAVVNARFVKPLDQDLIVEVAKRVRYVVTVEEGCKMGGFGSAVLEALSDVGVTHVTTKVLGSPGLVHRARTAGLPARTVRIDGGRHLPEREGIYRQEPASTREKFTLASSADRLPHGDDREVDQDVRHEW